MRLSLRAALFIFAFAALPMRGLQAAPIVFGTPQNITGDSDVFNVGGSMYGFNWTASSPTVNGVSFTGWTFSGTPTFAASPDGNLSLSITGPGAAMSDTTNGYTSTANPFALLSSAYRSILIGGVSDSGGSGQLPITATMNNLSLGHVYSVQVFENDPRPKAGRFATFTSSGTSTAQVAYTVANVAGSPGQWDLGVFTADASNNSFTFTGNANTQINAMQLRDVTGVWSGTTDNNLNNSTANFTNATNFTTVSGLVNTIYFADTDGLGNPVTHSNIAVQNGGISTGSITFQNNTLNYSLTSSDSLGVTGSTSIVKTGSGMLTLSGTHTYTGGTTLNAGVTQFNPNAVPSAGQITVNSAAALNAVGAYGSVNDWLASGKIATNSGGVLALIGDSSQDINMTGYPNLSLGATVNSNFSGTLTPAGTTYRVGGGAAMLTISKTNALSGSNALVVGGAGAPGVVVLASSNSYSGGTTLASGTLSISSAGNLGANTTGNNIAVGAGSNLLLAADANIGTNQKVTVSSTSSAVGGIGISYTPAALPSFNNTGSLGGVFGINYTGTAGITSMATLDSALNTGGATGHWFLGSQSAGNFTGTLAAASDKIYRLGGGGGTLTISGSNALSGANSLTIGQVAANGAGTVIISAPQSQTGATSLVAGVLNVNSDSALGAAPAAPASNINFNGSATLQAGAALSLNSNRTITINNSSTATVDSNGYAVSIPGNIGGANGSLNITGNGSVTLTGTESYQGPTSVLSGTLNYNGSSTTGANSNTLYGLNVATTSGAATVNINTSGTLFFGSTGIGGGTGAGAVNQNSGIVNYRPGSNYVNIGSGGYGSYNLSGGTLNTTNSTGIKIGFGGLGSFVQTGGTLNDNRYFIVGTQSPGGNGVATFIGGTASLTNGTYNVDIGDAAGAVGVMNIGTLAGGNAVFNTGSNGVAGVQVTDFLETTGSGTVNLNSGTLAVQGAPLIKGGAATSTATVNLNGGTLQAGFLNTTLIDNTLDHVNVFNGGVIIDTNGTGTSISASLSGTNGNGIYAPTSGGVIAVSNNGGSGYIGAPLVAVSGGGGSGAMAIANVSNGVITGMTLTAPGQGYTAGDTITFSFAGGGANIPAANYQYTLQPNDLAANTSGGLTKIGDGSLDLTASNTYTGATAINAGTLILDQSLTTSSSFTVNNNATASLSPNGSHVLATSSLTVNSSAMLDLNDNDAIVAYTSSSPISTIRDYLASGFNVGNWNGTGIDSSAAHNDSSMRTALGYADAADVGLSSLDGASITGNAVVVKYTYYGDANLDRTVDTADFQRFLDGFATGGTFWSQGDFTYDGKVDLGNDFNLFIVAYLGQGNSLGALAPIIAGDNALSNAQKAQLLSVVPEPSMIGLAGLVLVAAAQRRRAK